MWVYEQTKKASSCEAVFTENAISYLFINRSLQKKLAICQDFHGQIILRTIDNLVCFVI